jgi:hypothetical protein
MSGDEDVDEPEEVAGSSSEDEDLEDIDQSKIPKALRVGRCMGHDGCSSHTTAL